MKQAGSGAKTVGSQDPEEPSPRRVAAGTEEEPKSDELAGRYYTVADLRQEDLEPPPTINSNDPNEDEGEQIDEEEHREENDDTKNDSRQDTEKTKDRENTNEEDDEEMDELRRDSDGLICYEEDEEEALRRIWRERCLSRKKSDGEDFNLYDEREEEVSPRERRRRNLPREENYDNDEIIIEEVDEKNLARRERQRRHIPRKKSYDDVITVEEVDKEELSRRERQRRLLPQTKRNQRNRPNQEAASRPTPETLSSEDPVSDGSTRRVPPPINQPSTTPLFTEPVQSPKPLARSATDLTLARGETSQAAEHLAVSLEPLGLESQVRLGVFQQLINLFRRGRRNPTTDVEKANGSSNHAAVTPKGLVLPPKLSLWRSNVDKTLVHVAEEEGLEIDMLKQLLECVLVFLKTHGPEVSVHNPPPNGVASADAAAEPSSNTTRPAKEPPTITVQKVLDHVYESGVLERPKIEGKKSTRKHLTALGTALSACNTWTFLTPGTDHFRSWAAGSLANLTISELLGDGKHRRDRDSDRDILSFISFGSKRSKYGTFTADDLDIGTLTDIGEIRIKWTCVAEDHLILDMGGSRYDDASSDGDGDGYGNSEPTLSLYWFDAVELSWLAAYFYKDCDENEATLTALEILRTWSFLFQPRNRSRCKAARKAYESLEIPSWVANYLETLPKSNNVKLDDLETLGDIIDAKLDKHIHDMQQHMNPNLQKYNVSKRGHYSYRLFKRYGARIARLRHHMDKKKPKGWRQLWRDNRDSSAYYAFWAVFIFGVSSLVLSALSLLMSIVQAWASVKALRSN